IALAAGLRRRHDHPVYSCEGLEKRPAGARRVDEHHMAGRKLVEQPGVILRRQIRTRYVERRLPAVEAAMAEEDHEDLIVRRHARRQAGEGRFDVLARRTAADAGRIDFRLLGKINNVAVGDAVPTPSGVDERSGPFVELIAVLLVACGAHDHDEMGFLGAERTREREQQKESHVARAFQARGQATADIVATLKGSRYVWRVHHANPRARRYIHSVPVSAIRSSNTAGISHRSRSSTTVTPRPP